jgi:glutamyl-tRNA reductase
MKIFVAGLNHNTADVEVREKVAFNGSSLEEGLRRFRELPEIEEAMILFYL